MSLIPPSESATVALATGSSCRSAVVSVGDRRPLTDGYRRPGYLRAAGVYWHFTGASGFSSSICFTNQAALTIRLL